MKSKLQPKRELGVLPCFGNPHDVIWATNDFFSLTKNLLRDVDEWPFATAMATANPVMVARKSLAGGRALKFGDLRTLCASQM